MVIPDQVGVTPGEKGAFTAYVARTGGFAGSVMVSASDVSPFKIKVKSNTVSTTCSSASFSFTVAKSAKPGTHQIVFTGQDASGKIRTARLDLVIQ